MRKKFPKAFKAYDKAKNAAKSIVKKVVNFSKNDKKIKPSKEPETITKLKNQVKNLKRNKKSLSYIQNTKIEWLEIYDEKTGDVLKKKRKIKTCYSNKHCCHFKKKRRNCEDYICFLGDNFCSMYNLKRKML